MTATAAARVDTNNHGATIRRISHLDPLPVIAQRLLDDLSNRDSGIQKLAKIVEMDPGLSARIIGLSNSAYYAPPTPVYSVEDAIGRVLGLAMVRSLALGMVLSGSFDTRRCRRFSIDRYWFTAMATARFAHTLLPHVRVESPLPQDSVYLGGVLHNLGLLAFTSVFPGEMDHVLAEALVNPDMRVSAIEQEVLGTDHHQAGGMLARKWHLPEPVVAVIESHGPEDCEGEHRDLCRLVNLCSRVVQSIWREDAPVVDPNVLERLGIEEAQFATTLERFLKKTGELQVLARQIAEA